jgi:hypothetical protein
MGKIVFTASTLASAATAFGLGALVFSGHAAPADAAAEPQPTRTVTAPAAAPDKAAEGAKATSGKGAAPSTKAAVKAGSKGPLRDAQGDGKVLDDVAKTFIPRGVGISVPDELIPFPGRDTTNTNPTNLPPGVVPAQPEGTYTDPDAGSDTSDDVVSGAPGESTNDNPTNNLPADAPRPAPGGVKTAPNSGVVVTLPSGVVPSGVIPALPSGVLPVGVVVAN